MTERCLICGQRMPFSFSWRELIRLVPFRRALLYPVQHWLCVECQEALEWIKAGCSRCSKPLTSHSFQPGAADQLIPDPLPTHADHLICPDCEGWLTWEEQQAVSPVLKRNISLLRYNRWAQDVLTRYKFQGDERLKYLLASLMVFSPQQQLWQPLFMQADLITAVPLSPGRLQERGFNQAERVAELVAHFFNKPFFPQLLLRQDDGVKQSKRDRLERLTKMFDRFLNNPHHLADIKNKRIVVIDDIYTTGATMHAAAHCLRQGGAGEVVSVTLAR